MAIGASTVWRVRVGGNDANGAGYDSTISGAGTDYSQQDSPQLGPLTDIACSNTTTVTSATGGFTSAMIGNAIRITGGGATSGYYFITGQTDTNTVTVDRTPGTVTNGTARVGGAAANFTAAIFASGNSAGNKAVAGNTIYIRGSGSDTPSSADYTMSTWVTPTNGDATSGYLKIWGENGRPYISVNGLLLYNASYQWYKNLWVHVTGVNGSAGVINTKDWAKIDNCRINMNNNAVIGISLTSGDSIVKNCHINGGQSSASANAPGSNGITANGLGATISGCVIRGCRDHGISATNTQTGLRIVDCIIRNNRGSGVYIQGSAGYQAAVVRGNVIDANFTHGIHVNTTAALRECLIENNLITNHNQSSKYGINVAAGSASLNDQFGYVNNNAYYNNTSNYNGISAGSSDIACSVDPYTNAAGDDYTLNNTATGGQSLRDGGFPQEFPGLSATNAYTPIGLLGTPAAFIAPSGLIARNIGTY